MNYLLVCLAEYILVYSQIHNQMKNIFTKNINQLRLHV